MLGPDPEGDTERDEKVRFLDEFDALATLRDDLRAAGFRPDGTLEQTLRRRDGHRRFRRVAVETCAASDRRCHVR